VKTFQFDDKFGFRASGTKLRGMQKRAQTKKGGPQAALFR